MEGKTKMKATTNCSICLEMYTEPKILPCIHTFCAKCLEATATKANKKPGDHLECPLPACRKPFPIPHEGLAELQKNFFIEKLVTLTKILEMKGGQCNGCIVKEESSLATKASPITSYCCNCSLKLCIDCCKHHKKGKLTKTHKLVVIDNQPITTERMEMLASDQCEQHKEEELKLYCIDCKSIICALCYIESHQSHNWSDIKIAAEGYRKTLFENIGAVSTSMDTVQRKEKKFEKSPGEIADKIRAMRNEVEKRRVELKRLVDKHADVLLGQLDSLRKIKLNEIEKEREDLSRHINCLESFKSYVTKVAEKGTATDICHAVNSVNERAIELKAVNENITQRQLSPLNVSFWKTDLQKFSSSRNILGTIQDKSDGTKETTKSGPAEEIKDLLMKIEQLQRETEIEKSKRQETINIINKELARERTSKRNWLLKEKQLGERVKQLEHEVTLLNQKRETEKFNSQKRQETINMIKEKQLNDRVKQLEQEVALLNQKRETEKFNSQKRQEKINILNQELVQERMNKNNWSIKEMQLHDRVKELEQKVTLLDQKTTAAQIELEDERKENKTLDSEIMKYLQNEREFSKERSSFASRETQLNELVKKLTCQRKQLGQAFNKYKQEVVSGRTICKSLKAENRKFHEQQDILQAELHSLKKERILKASALQERERKERTAVEEQLRNVTSQLEQERLFAWLELKAARNQIQNLQEKLTERDRTISNERQKLLECKTELLKPLFNRLPGLRYQPVTWTQVIMEKTVQCFSSFMPTLLTENELIDDFNRVLQSQGTLRIAKAIGGVAFLGFLIVGLYLSILCFLLYRR